MCLLNKIGVTELFKSMLMVSRFISSFKDPDYILLLPGIFPDRFQLRGPYQTAVFLPLKSLLSSPHR